MEQRDFQLRYLLVTQKSGQSTRCYIDSLFRSLESIIVIRSVFLVSFLFFSHSQVKSVSCIKIETLASVAASAFSNDDQVLDTWERAMERYGHEGVLCMHVRFSGYGLSAQQDDARSIFQYCRNEECLQVCCRRRWTLRRSACRAL